MMMRSFVEKRRDITETELMDYLSFCQMLPGPSSSQTVALIGYKRGGILLGVLTLLVWILPAASLMIGLSFLIKYINAEFLQDNVFHYIQPMAVGFIVYAAIRTMKISIKSKVGIGIMLLATALTVFIRSPWVFPLTIIIGGLITNFTNKEFPPHDTKSFEIKWRRLGWFILLFVIAGVLSELARTQAWENARGFNLFENFYRFGSIVFGGGHALIPMMHDQFIFHANDVYGNALISNQQFLTGVGLVHAIPGPVFSLCSYVGALCMDTNPLNQLLGGLIGTVGVFLPGALILFFLFPLYQNLKQYRVIFRALEGIHGAVIGILWGSAIVLFNTMPFEYGSILVIASTALALNFSKIPAPIIVVFWLLMGIVF
jgi:chromate transporter